ncbi:hypothetical protein GCM10011346_46770 [Oceanobacillus neutriphilus]|uniref:Uncharacterized protein n=2 Tax=Oceanobacillus neutriphilus TaxID=531815 RepID=A0ABQ2P233_9BACI|nr:hypothetical protein GCM10011346_46770 [Oceanobacillus neutriphilus]
MIDTLDEIGEVQFNLLNENEKVSSSLFENFKVETENLLLD